MRYGSKEVFDLEIYDESGKFVVKLDTLENSFLSVGAHSGEINITDSLVNDKLLKFVGQEVSESQSSDFENALSNNRSYTEITLGNGELHKRCKLIGRGIWRSERTGEDKEFVFSADNAKLKLNVQMYNSYPEVASFPWTFALEKDKNNKIVRLRIPN